MEHLFHAFRRVQKGLDDPNVLLELFQRHENLNDPSTVSVDDRIRLLDFPPRSVQDESIASVTTLTKKELVKRGAEFPAALSENEMKLLMARYWLDGMKCHIDDAFMNALDILEDIKEDYSTEVCDRLDRFREPLYDENECKAIENAGAQSIRRRKAENKQELQQDLARVFAEGKPWLQQLWQEDGSKTWGYAVFESPQFVADPKYDVFKGEQKKAMERSLCRIGSGLEIYRRYKMETQSWPSQISSTHRFLEVVDKLRQQFKNRRNRGSLSDGLLPNVFLYLDHESATSLFVAHGHVDAMWIWAVDPDYECENDPTGGYQGYVRVGFKQLVDNFYVARRWQSDLSMKDLWNAAQRESNKAFVSVEPETLDKLPLRIESNNVAPENLRLFHPIRND
ncbi:uncharacterized protein N7446_008401 [Penicillium canescens]|uniref:Uncharacterized protein n=1 Tax=Penicillium canescens TaxID=5083 RepID=A0AAD6IN74_PENCN|nr:uncharacterized protein N7446_008401 [Penicillium canescens]KAJ6033309.1 hypothetical protein N7444_011080 [Penicillium canescens]KAJ6057502.1 hypothetical protein N7460_000776 [Penicillium canescens]KAJ6058818.1 hypothetical protein N7446_008401 [Penicillium canescens]